MDIQQAYSQWRMLAPKVIEFNKKKYKMKPAHTMQGKKDGDAYLMIRYRARKPDMFLLSCDGSVQPQGRAF